MKKTIVMIHGMWGGGWYWDNFKQYFEKEGYECHTPDLRFHDTDPEKPPPSGLGTTSLLDYAQDLEAFIHTLNDKPVLMGHSMGGLLSQMLGERGLASSLILLTPASPSGINALRVSVIKTFWSVLTTWGFWNKPQRVPFDAAVYGILNRLPKTDQKTEYDKFVYESGRASAEIGFWYLDPNKTTRIDASKVDCPVLVVCGSHDRITPTSIAKKVVKKYNTVSSYIEVENRGHWLAHEQGWEKIAETISHWIKKRGGVC